MYNLLLLISILSTVQTIIYEGDPCGNGNGGCYGNEICSGTRCVCRTGYYKNRNSECEPDEPNPPATRYGQWGSWRETSCSVTCGHGVNTERRTRSCLSGSCSSADLRQTRERSCSKRSCNGTYTVHFTASPTYSQWGNWQVTSCSVTCGIGVNTQRRTRSCLSGTCSQAYQLQIRQRSCSRTVCQINYGEPCVSKGTCKNQRTDCYSSTCRCNPGYFWKDNTCLPNANLSPGNIDTETLSTTQLKITWTPSAYPAAVTEYLVKVSPFVSSKNIVITGTSATISSLTPGERYRITVSSRSSYLNRGETAATGAVLGITKPAPTSGLAPATSLTEPTAQIFFNKSDGRAESYTVTLTRNGYNSVQSVSGSQDILSASFPGVAAGLPYNLTVITNSYGVSSVPFTQWLRVRAEASEAVVGLSVYEVSSRAASLSWKRPINTKGALFKYSIEVYNSATCVQRINILCIECLQAMNVTEPFEISCERENNAVISQSNLNNVNFLVRYGLSLLPATAYDVVVAAYNEEGKGRTDQVTLVTEEEAPSMSNSERPIIDVVRGTETEKSVILLTCLPCLFENSNGVIVKSGILVCAKAACPIRNVKEVKTAEDYDESPNWDTSSSVSFKTWYRATGDDWLKGKEASDEIRFVLGEESCGVQDQSRFCNGPLPVDRTYRVWLFACTRVACSEGEYVEFTLLVKDKSLPLAIIGAIVGGGVLLVLAVVLLVLYIKVIRPRSQRQRSTKYVSDTSPKDDTYAEIGDGLGVVQDGRLDVDHNKKDSPPFSENAYDQLKVYSNQGQHDYGKIKVKY